MPASWMTALALSAQIAAPALPTAPPRISLHDSTLISTLAPVRDTTTRQQAAPQPSKRGRMIAGALLGFAVGSALGVTVGQEACLNQSKWVCVAKGGGFGAAVGLLIARK